MKAILAIFTGFFWRVITAVALCFIALFGLFFQRPQVTAIVEKNGSLAGVDALGRQTTSAGKSDKQVGLFYFVWAWDTGGPYDNTKIVAADPGATDSEEAWIAAGGGPLYNFHFWGEPLFGYYVNTDDWVYRKHCQMLTDAGVDFLVFDATNAYIYENALAVMLPVWYEYHIAGWDVPKLSFYTNTESGRTMNEIYDAYYNNAALQALYPRLDELWYRWPDSGKPFIVGDAGDPVLRPEVRDYFRIRRNQWPNFSKEKDGFPWMEFDRHMTLNAVYGRRGRGSVMNVSGSQHNDTVRMSSTAWYGGNDRTRAWHGKANDPDPLALLGGANFTEQWDFIRKLDPDVVFITGFNEWVAQRQPAHPGEPIVFVDSADTLCSRDTEPSAGILGDNYYMQMVDEIRKFKNGMDKQAPGLEVYYDYENDIADRDARGFGNTPYQDFSGRNDITRMTVRREGAKFILTVETRDALVAGPNWMTLFINANGTASGWEGYDYVVGRETPGLVERSAGDWEWAPVGMADITIEDSMITLEIPRAMLGDVIGFQFKWADNYIPGDVYSFYTSGDAAPMGRLNFRYSEACE